MSGHPLPTGSKVRVTGVSDDGEDDAGLEAGRVGSEYLVFEHVPEGAKGNDDPEGKAYYLLDDQHSIGGSHWAYPENVELVMDPGQLAARELPSLLDVAIAVSSGMHRLMNDGMEFDETQVSGPEDAPYVVAHGETDEGLRIGAKIAVLEVWREDG